MNLVRVMGYGASSNTYLVYDNDRTDCIIIDPSGSAEELSRAVAELGIEPSLAVLTHGHFDHIDLLDWVRDTYHIQAAVHEKDQALLTDPKKNVSALFGAPLTVRPAEQILQEGDEIAVGEESLHVIHTPGHSEGGICLYAPNLLLSGDTLFDGSVGRTDFDGGSMVRLTMAIEHKLMTLPENTPVYPGHGGTTTIERERRYNPCLFGGKGW